MSPQDHANHLLAIWQQRRDLPPEQRLSDAIDRFRAVGGKFAWEKDRSPESATTIQREWNNHG